MVQRPDTKYVEVGDADVAYQVIGDGPNDVLYFYGLGSHVEVQWTMPGFEDFIERLLRFSRVIVFDRRGTGASDGIARTAIPTFEEWTEDVLAVLDAAGSEQTAIIASIDAGPVALLFAAQHPERVSALVLLNSTARYRRDDDYPIGATSEEVDVVVDFLRTTWGTLDFVRAVNPDRTADIGELQEVAVWARYAATPRTAGAQYRYIMDSLDVRQALPLIQAPTRVLHVAESLFLPVAHGRYLAEHIPGATFVEIPGGSLALVANLDVVADETADLLTGQRLPIEVDRILTTVLFTDIVGSTERAASLGDHNWRSLLDDHDRAVREQLKRFRGREINTTGDGFVMSFDGPARAIQCASAILQATSVLGIDLRAGVHTGECEVRGDDLGGLAVHIAARIDACAGPGEIFASSVVRDLVVGSGIEFDDRGSHELKGVPGSWSLFAVRQRRT